MIYFKQKDILLRCISSGYRIFLEPHSRDKDQRRKEFIITVILFGTICFLSLLAFLFFYQYFFSPAPENNRSPFFFALICGLFGILYTLTRKGKYRLSSFILIGLYTLGTTYSALRWGPDLYQIVLSFALIIVIAGILFSIRFGIFLTSLISFFIIFITAAGENGLVQFNQSWKNEIVQMNDVIGFSITYFMIMFICWLSNREIERSFMRARKSEKALQEKNESLEIEVMERTQEIRKIQAEKMFQLYRFAEFGRLSSGIFHDLMTPLSLLSTSVHELEHSLEPEVIRIKENINRAVEASHKMETFISTIKKHISITSEITEINVNEEIKEVITLFNYKTLKAGLSIDFFASRQVSLYGSPVRFQQIIANLLSNAIDACENIFLADEDCRIIISLTVKEDFVAISVKDHGCGIKEEFFDKIFDPFFTSKAEHKGMGLGLSTTKEVIENDFKGSVSVFSVEGEGSEFIVRLPLSV